MKTLISALFALINGILITFGLILIGESIYETKKTEPDVYNYSGNIGSRTSSIIKSSNYKLDIPLRILDEICPEVSEWVREKDKNGLIEIVKEPNVLARYGYFTGILKLEQNLLKQNNVIIASTLAHEYIHSRQNIFQYIHHGLVMFLSNNRDTEYLEREAESFERKIYINIVKPEELKFVIR